MKPKGTIQGNRRSPEHPDENELAQYAEYLRHETGEIPDELIEHVSSCSYCRAELMAISDMLDSLPDLAGEPVQPAPGYELKGIARLKTSRFQWLGYAAAVAAIILIVWGITRLFPERPMHEPLAGDGGKDSTLTNDSSNTDRLAHQNPTPGFPVTDSSGKSTSLPDTLRYASAFVPNPMYESLVGARYRSSGDPHAAGPGPSTIFSPGDTLEIFWKPVPGDEYSLIILDNMAKTVKEIQTGSSALLAWKIDLKPGLYYWKFLGKEELWKVGKMRVIDTP